MTPTLSAPAVDKAKEREETLLALTALAALVLHFLVARSNPSLAWQDEIFQTLEQGHRLAFGYGVVPWEFRDGTRSWVLPGLLGGVMRVTAFMGPGSAGYLTGVRLFLALCSVVPAIVAMVWARREKLPHPWVAGLATAIWFELVFFASKALTEVFAAYAIAVALFFCVAAREEAEKRLPRAELWAGLALGFAVSFRFHLLPAVLLALAWTGRKELARWKLLLPGFVGVLLAFGLLDWVTWSYPFQSFIKNFVVNVFEGKASSFGTAPAWEYLRAMAVTWGWGALPLLVLAGLSFRRWPLLGATALVILISHSAIAHKEYRFLVPFFVIIVIAASLELPRLLQSKPAHGLVACVLFALASADGARRYDYRQLPARPEPGPFDSMWGVRAGELDGFSRLSTEPTLCGVGVVGWGDTGGYTYLHRDVPIYNVTTKEGLEQLKPRFNFMVTFVENGPEAVGFKPVHCASNGMCLFSREGDCVPEPGYHINSYLSARGM